MPLTLKISGFKSFIEPTTIPFSKNLMAIVGPNGCGKSNIIDAIRWVLGEISAKHMRGESMSDVIFNGSTNRKPLGQASVELIFDNSAVHIGGEYAKYGEIAIRREVNRDGISNYYFNNTLCRRKDILNIFLGTGLKYSIIEQGMVSQIVEANPEELRIYLEEAAGVSKYKERRRETESRIANTRENLTRLADIRYEIESQLKVLKKQSNLASVYKKLREEERSLKAKLQALYWHVIDLKIKELESAVQGEDVHLQKKLALQRQIEADLESRRQKNHELGFKLEEVQNRFYVLGADITQLEQRINYNQERKEQLTDDLKKLHNVWQEAQQHKVSDIGQIELLQAESTKLQFAVATGDKELSSAEMRLNEVEQAFGKWQKTWEKFTQAASQVIQRLEIENTHLQHWRSTAQRESESIAKLEDERRSLTFNELKAEIANLSRDDEEFRLQVDALKETLDSMQQKIVASRLKVKTYTDELNRERSALQEFQGEQAALKALQKDALGGSEEKVLAWLKANGLLNCPRIAQELKVDIGWEKAVEVVLGNYLEAVCHEDLQNLLPLLPTLRDVAGDELIFFAANGCGRQKLVLSDITKGSTLADKAQCSWAIADVLRHVYCADNLPQALQLRRDLQQYESVITPDGIWLGISWMRIPLQSAGKFGVLQRENELRQLQKVIVERQYAIEREDANLQRSQRELASLERKQHALQQELTQFIDRKSTINSALNVRQANLSNLLERAENLNGEVLEHKEILIGMQQRITELEKIWQQLSQDKEAQDKQRLELLNEKKQYEEKLYSARGHIKRCKEETDAVNMRLQLVCNQVAYLEQSLQRIEKQAFDLDQRREELEQALEEVVSPVPQLVRELETKLEQKLVLEKSLVDARVEVAKAEDEMREQEKVRAKRQEEAEQIRERLAQLRIEKQGLEVNASNHISQIDELGFELDAVLAAVLPEFEQKQIDEQILLGKIEKNNLRTERLGPINLAAIDEYNKQKERKDYLDAQNEDLLNALSTLENAMHKIDGETRLKLRATYDQVNANLQVLFPKIFGGGKASLQLTGDDDLLQAGVTVWAQPPGKRNATIHLLSGGEKALAAVALLFAIFQINPAPFCLLDEVDAPFDDENIGRFCQLVKEMAQSIQFIYISHNKLSMEIADQLLGVTMQEPGVSRIVSVDIEQAMRVVGDG